MGILIKEVSNLRELKKFISFQYELYRENKYWVPPLRSDENNSLRKDKNPAFDFCEAAYWLAYKDGEIVGRIAGIINKKYNEVWKKQTARFGWFDFIDDHDVSSALLTTVEIWAANKGMKLMNGPLGFTDMDAEGTLVMGFEEVSTFGALYNYPYYPEHIEKCGYLKDADWVEYEVDIHKEVPEKVARIADIALKRNNLKILKVKKAKEFLPYSQQIFEVLNSAYSKLFGFVELSQKQIDLYIKQYFSFILPEYVPVILDSENNVIAFGITMPSLSHAFQKNKGRLFPFGFLYVLKAMKNNKKADLYLTAVKPEYQERGINAILINEINKLYIKNGVEKVETNRELEENEKIQAQWKFFDRRLHKRRRCYKKEIASMQTDIIK